MYDPRSGFAGITVSENGVLAYQAGGPLGAGSQLTWFDRAGRQLGAVGPPASYFNPKLSPDGKRAAVENTDPQTGNRDIWLVELQRDLFTRFTFDPAQEVYPVWSPDGSRIVFASNRNGPFNLYQKLSSGAGAEELLLKSDVRNLPHDWSTDGRFMSYSVPNDPNGTSFDIWVLPLSGERKPFPFIQTPFTKVQSQISPDGRWLAYYSNESGRNEAYIQSFPKPGSKWQVSTRGGSSPRWRHDGKELFFITDNRRKIMSVSVKADSVLELGAPAALFDIHVPASSPVPSRQYYDVTPDGQRFLIDTLVQEASSSPITVVLNWAAGLKR